MGKRDILIGLTIALLVAVLVSPFASPLPDGLERVAKDHGFLEKGEEPPLFPSPFPDYRFPGFQHERWSTPAAGLVGAAAMFGIGCGIAALIKKRKR
jgi:cobalt/nickel transport protein